MSLFYKLRQNNDPKNPISYKKWYARAYHPETVTLRDLSVTMQANCTVKRSDILAVLAELSDTMQQELQAGRKVCIDGLGTFTMGLTSRGVDQPGDFRTDRDILGMHIVFRPEKLRNLDGTTCQMMTKGARAQPLPTAL